MQLKKIPLFTVLLIIVGTVMASCDDEFDPITGELSGFYSIFGYLDAELDTHWVRVMPIRETVEVSVDSIDARVTLSEVGGASVVMTPKAYTSIGSFGEPVTVWNYWAVMDIDYETTYEVSVENDDGSKTYAQVTTPADFDEPLKNGTYVDMALIDTLADVRLNWIVRDNVNGVTREFDFSHLDHVSVIRGGIGSTPSGYRALIETNDDFLEFAPRMGYITAQDAYSATLSNEIEVIDSWITVVGAGDVWVDFGPLSEEEIVFHSTQANVVNGVGYVVGTISKEIPFPMCVGDFGELLACNR